MPPLVDCALRRELEEGGDRHRCLTTHRNIFPTYRGAHTRRRLCHWLCTKRHRIRRVCCHKKLPRPARQLRRPHLRGGTHAKMERHTGVQKAIPGLCRQSHTARTNRGYARHRRRNRLPRHHQEAAQRPEAILAIRTMQPKAAILHYQCLRLRHKQGGGQRAGAHQARTGRLQVEQRGQRHCLRTKRVGQIHQV